MPPSTLPFESKANVAGLSDLYWNRGAEAGDLPLFTQ